MQPYNASSSETSTSLVGYRSMTLGLLRIAQPLYSMAPRRRTRAPSPARTSCSGILIAGLHLKCLACLARLAAMTNFSLGGPHASAMTLRTSTSTPPPVHPPHSRRLLSNAAWVPKYTPVVPYKSPRCLCPSCDLLWEFPLLFINPVNGHRSERRKIFSVFVVEHVEDNPPFFCLL
jgi:hypothetical protein